jgi:hypothetical protein
VSAPSLAFPEGGVETAGLWTSFACQHGLFLYLPALPEGPAELSGEELDPLRHRLKHHEVRELENEALRFETVVPFVQRWRPHTLSKHLRSWFRASLSPSSSHHYCRPRRRNVAGVRHNQSVSCDCPHAVL